MDTLPAEVGTVRGQKVDPKPLDPRDLDPRALLERTRALGVNDSSARRWTAGVVGRGDCSHEHWTRSYQIPKRVLPALKTPLERLTLERIDVSSRDRFEKLLFRTPAGLPVESVLIPLEKPGALSICLSSQVGCAMACRFCATARMADRANLETWEIVDQFVQARERAHAQGRRVTGAVFMGMGEPFLNYDRVLAAAELLACPFGAAVAGPSMTISTVGLTAEIDRFTQENRRFRLAISLGAATDAKRAEIVPIAARTPVKQVVAAAARHASARRTRVMISYVCISGFNVGEDDARELGRLFNGIPIRFDLIDVADPTGRYLPPAPDELASFRDALAIHLAQPTARRYSGGADINAACGTLAGS